MTRRIFRPRPRVPHAARRRFAAGTLLLLLLCAAQAACARGATGRARDASPDAAALYVSTRGDDRDDGRSPESALRTISEAASRARPGTTVYIERGTYYERVVTRRGGEPGREVTFTSYRGTAVIDGSRESFGGASDQNLGLVELRHPHVRLKGLHVANSRNTGVLLNADHLTVEGCEVSGAAVHGVSTHTARQTRYPGLAGTMIREAVVRGNTVRGCSSGGRGQAVSIIADGFVVSGNRVRDNAREGIDVWLGARRGEVSGNEVAGNGAAGIYVDGAAYVRIQGNRVFNNPQGIGVSSEDANYPTHDVWVYNNLVYNNAGAGCFLWDDLRRPGHKGAQNVLFAHNTLFGNRHSFYLVGERNSVRVVNNLGLSRDGDLYDESVRSSVHARDNVWLTSAAGFVSAERGDFRLTRASPAIDKGRALAPFKDDAGRPFSIATDLDGANRVVGRNPDAGAYEYR